jgi:DNA-binding NtrC family response regulator
MFGHEKGAFTGAVGSKIGLVEAVRGGTLFLDEVGDIPLSLQVKLLRLMEAGTYRRIGGVEPLRADFRLVAATHRNLAEMVKEGTFRQDLFFRINVFPIPLPPLRERKEDLPMLVDTLLARLDPVHKITLSKEALSALMQHDFPGNVRELRNVLERALIMVDGNTIQPHHFYLDTIKSGQPETAATNPTEEIAPLVNLEKRYLEWAAANFQGDRKTLAERLGISERTLYRKLRDIETE